MFSTRIIAAISLFASLAGSAEGKEPIIPLVPLDAVEGSFMGRKDQNVATDISGMACVPLQGGTRNCLIINDENSGAQFATLRNDRMVVGKFIPLIGDADDPETLGSPPKAKCKEGKGKFNNLDGEGVAYAAPFFYVVGSHGCGRGSDKFHLSSFILARIRVDAQGRPVDASGAVLDEREFAKAVETTYRVSDWLQGSKEVGDFFEKNLKEKKGLNIEGVAVHGDRIWFGLRAPVTKVSSESEKLKKQAFIVGGDIADLFAPGHKPSKAEPETVFFDLSKLGMRDLAALPDGRLLVLAGPTSDEKVPFRLFVADPGRNAAKPIGTLAKVKGWGEEDGERVMKTGKAEGVTLLEVKAGTAQAVILFDGLENGAPNLAKFAIPEPD